MSDGRGAAPRPPVFIVGLGRGGTSLLYRILQLQKPFSLGPGRQGGEGSVDLTETTLFRDPAWLLDVAAPSAHLLRQFLLFDEAAIARVAAAGRRVPRWRAAFLRLAWPRASSERIRVRLWRASRADRLLRLYLEAAREARGTPRLVEKTPFHADYLPEIRASVPGRQILFSVRHPLDAYASLRRRAERHRKIGRPLSPWLLLSPEAYTEWARDRLRIGLRARRQGARDLMLVRYEDLISDPAGILARIGTFLDEPLDPACLPTDERERWNSARDPRLFGPITDSRADWREFIDPETAARLEAGLADEMRSLGYLPSAARPGPVGVLALPQQPSPSR